MSTFILETDLGGTGVRLAIKDLIDVAGLPTTAGCRARANVAAPAGSDAACLAEIRRRMTAGRLRLVGKTNLHELAFGTTGRNPWFGTPRNPLDETLIPGGSSSGSAVSVANGDADVALGSDTGGSVRIPAACCGVVGLKTSWGRISTAGTLPLAPTLDTIGPIARTVDGVIDGMRLLEPGFEPASVDVDALRILRLRVPAHPDIDRAVDSVLERMGLPVQSLVLAGWEQARRDAGAILSAEAWRANKSLLQLDPSGVSASVTARLQAGSSVSAGAERTAREGMVAWRHELARTLAPTTVIVLPTLADSPPSLDARRFDGTSLTMPVNLAGLPAVTVPVPTRGPIPAGLQIIGVENAEELLVTVAHMIERALQ